MKYFNIDFAVFFEHVETWNRLTHRSRGTLLRLKPSSGTPGARFGDDLDSLLAEKLVSPYTDGLRVRLHEDFRDSSKALRAMARHPIATEPSQNVLSDYLTDHFTADEREGMVETHERWFRSEAELLTRVSSSAHVAGFLETKDARAWEAERLPVQHPWLSPRQLAVTKPLLSDAGSVRDLRTLLGTLSAQPAPVSFVELRERLKKLSRPRLARAVLAGIRYVLCFPVLTESTFEPGLTLWPAVARRLCRVAATRPEAVEPGESFHSAWAVEDVTQLLIAAAEPLRLRGSDGQLFAKAQRGTEAGLIPFPAWLDALGIEAFRPSRRLELARELAVHCALIQTTGTAGQNLRLAVTDEGRAWLALPARERYKHLLDRIKPGTEPTSACEDDLLDLTYSPLSYGFLPNVGFFLGDTARAEAESTVVSLCSTLEPGRPVALHGFTRYGSEVENPLLNPDSSIAEALSYPGRQPSEEELEELWAAQLRAFVLLRLVPMGGARLGLLPDDFSIELTETGSYLLGLSDDLPDDTSSDVECPVRIQPDFEVVFLAPAPALEASFARFTQRTGHHVGSLFRITRTTILAAARAGLSLDEVLDTLRSSSPQPPPPNVEHEIRAWFDECRVLCLEPALVLRCPDVGTAHRLQSAGGRHLEPLTETVFLLPNPDQRTKLIQACKKAGIFIEGGEKEKAKKKKKRRARRRRYW